MNFDEDTDDIEEDESDILNGLSADQLRELAARIAEPSEKDTISEEDFNKLFTGWGTK
jgi:hypothetical protein